MTRITENAIEHLAIERLESLGYHYLHGQDIAPDSDTPERESFEQVLLLKRLEAAVKKINPDIPKEAQAEAIKTIQRITSTELINNNEAFHRYLTEGVPVSKRVDGHDRGDRVWLIDFNNPEYNEFLVVNQFTVVSTSSSSEGQNKRPDLVLFVNGIPLVVMELKNAADENATINSAFKQIETYKSVISNLFTYNAFIVISDGLEARAGTISAGLSRFMAWKTQDGITQASHLISQLEVLINGMLNKSTLLDLIRHFSVFESTKKEDAKTGITSVFTVKKLAAYHQYYAVNRAVESTLRASGYIAAENSLGKAAEDPELYNLPDVKKQPIGDRKGGVVWHTQGSGKSLSMVFYTGKIVLALDNPTILVITDRNDLDDQLYDTFAASKQLLRQEPVQAKDREHLKDLLKVASGGVVFTTIQKFQPEEGNIYEMLSERENIDIVNMDSEAKEMGLTDFEYAFYTAVADNNSARELMQKDKLRELAVVLTETIKQNASIDWTIKESVKAKLKVAVKRLLRKYGYPPDMQKLATETVLKQAEMIAESLVG